MSSFGFLLYVKVYERPGIQLPEVHPKSTNTLLPIQTHGQSVLRYVTEIN